MARKFQCSGGDKAVRKVGGARGPPVNHSGLNLTDIAAVSSELGLERRWNNPRLQRRFNN